MSVSFGLDNDGGPDTVTLFLSAYHLLYMSVSFGLDKIGGPVAVTLSLSACHPLYVCLFLFG